MQCIKKWEEECDNPTKTQNMGRSSLKAYCLCRQVTVITERGQNSEGWEKAFSASGRKLGLLCRGCCWLSPCCQQPPSFRAVTVKGQPARANEAKPDKAAFDIYMGKRSFPGCILLLFALGLAPHQSCALVSSLSFVTHDSGRN